MRDATMSMCAYLKLSVKYNGLTGTAPPGVGSTHLAQVIHSTDNVSPWVLVVRGVILAP